MKIIIIEKDTLLYDEFKFKCSIGKNGKTTKKIEGDNKTPKGLYTLGPLYYRKDRLPKLSAKLKSAGRSLFQQIELQPLTLEFTSKYWSGRDPDFNKPLFTGTYSSPKEVHSS